MSGSCCNACNCKRSVTYEDCEEAARFIKNKCGNITTGDTSTKMPELKIGVICGTGLGALADELTESVILPFTDVPHFPKATALGHKGNIVIGVLGGKRIMCLQGRYHAYEGYSTQQITLPVRVMHLLGVENLIVTNACGGLKLHHRMGDFMVISDHINLPGLVGMNPLVGPNDDRFGFRFPNFADVYDKNFIEIAFSVGQSQGIGKQLHKGVYCMVFGPMFATDREVEYIQQKLGADTIGMSTCPEVTVAAHQSMKVLGLSVITDCVAQYGETGPPTAELVLEQGKKSAVQLISWVRGIIEKM